MAISKGTFVAYTGADGGSTTVTSSSFDSSGAGLLIAAVCWEDTSSPTAVFTDSKGNTWQTSVVQNGTSGARAAMCWCVPTTVGSGHTVTCTYGASVPFRRICVLPVNGNFSTTDALDGTPQQAENAGGGTAVDAGSCITSAAAILAQCVADYGGETFTEGLGWTKDSATTGRHFQSRVEASDGTFDPVVTLGSSVGWSTVAMAFKETAGGGGGGSVVLMGQACL